MFLWQLILLSFAVSLDGLIAGLSYGMRNLRIPLFSVIIISLSSAFAVAAAMYLGWTLTQHFTEGISRLLGGVILISVGCWVALQGVRKEGSSAQLEEVKVYHGEKRTEINSAPVNFFKFLSMVMTNPREGDLDNSGSIDFKEAFFIGLALASDAFGAGVGVALSGFNIMLTTMMVGISKFYLINLGIYWGFFCKKKAQLIPTHFLAGGILILLGIFNIL